LIDPAKARTRLIEFDGYAPLFYMFVQRWLSQS
jgi:hypothetical protein